MRQFAPLLLVPVALALLAVGYEQYSVTEDVFGDTYHPRGSLGLVLIVTGFAIGYWGGIALAQPSWLAGMRAQLSATLRSPRRALMAGVVLGAIGLGLLSVTDEAGGFTVYHPYDWLGLELMLVASVLFNAGAWRLVSRARRNTESP
jgi:hypothetical protein